MVEVYIPKLGQTVEEVTLLKWLADDNTRIQEGDPVLEVETDKANFTVEATASGYLHRGPYKAGDVLPVLTVVALIGKADESFGANAPMQSSPATPVNPVSVASLPPVAPGADQVFASPRARRLAASRQIDLNQVKPTGAGGQRIVERDVLAYLGHRLRATPLAQNVAAAEGIDLTVVPGTGIGGYVTRQDVERTLTEKRAPGQERVPVAAAPGSTPETLERLPLTGVRRIIAERMGTSVHTTARVTLFMEADATELVAMRERLGQVREEWGFAPGYNDIIAKMVAACLRRFPAMNARLTSDAIEHLANVNIGMAVDTERGLLVPVIRDADKKSLREFSSEFRALVARAREGKALPDDLTGATFTITNLGMYDVMAFTPVINLPEAAILGVGAITPQPVVRNRQVEIRDMTVLSLVFDHRLVDGAPAARFLQYLKSMIQEPYLWVAA